LLAAGALVPLAEELLMRGYVLRLLVLWEREGGSAWRGAFGRAFDSGSVHALEPGAWTPLAVVGSTLVFAAGHAPEEWLAATAYGLLMASLWIVRKDLLSCVLAHAATNVALALYVGTTGRWELW
jgi:membrane protease YdiL (CAAX protease family)